jgi:glycosyltransferase involved in cell wall biosynthesis
MKNSIKICATCGLPDSVVVNHLTPVVLSNHVSELTLIRTTPGIPIRKVRYKLVPSFLRNYLYLSIFAKLILFFFENIFKKYDLFYAIYVVPHGLIAYLAAKIYRKPLVISLIGTDLNIRLKSKQRFFLLPILRGSDVINVTGNASKDFLIQSGISASKIQVMPNPINISLAISKNGFKKYDGIFVGRLAPEKSIDKIIKIVKQLIIKNPSFKFAILGDGPLRKELHDDVKRENLKEAIDFLGFQSNVYEFLNKSKFLLLTSKTEGIPLAMIEAMACGVPCVVPDVGDITDLANDNVNSLVVKSPYNIEDYSDAISKLLTDTGLYSKLSNNAKKVKDEYGFDNATRIWDDIFLRLIE